MVNSEPQGGWGASGTTAPNPFLSAMTSQPVNPFLKQAPNPFAPSNQPTTQGPIYNPFAPSTTPFNSMAAAAAPSLKRSASPSANQVADGRTTARNPFEAAKNASPSPDIKNPIAWTNKSGSSLVKDSVFTTSTKTNDKRVGQTEVKNGKTLPTSILTPSGSTAPGFGLSSQTTEPRGISNGSSTTKHDGHSVELASKIRQQLSKDRINPPPWPTNPGSHAQRQAMETFRESYKAYREKARKSLIKAGLVDDPNQRRTLEQALDFRGICEEMCPEWEKITRIVEYDVRNPEKTDDGSGSLLANPSIMVKRLARSAAGQDAPLPMDVRSFVTLRKTLDYLINDLIPEDSVLPSRHNFLWDRTRAIRIDLSVQKYNLTTDERADLLYCLETIARFHVTSLHLLSRDGFAAEDFSEQQEIEQLGKTLMSLKEMYDDCAEQDIECENEAEFRAYYIVFNARNPSIKETVEGWGSRLWNSEEIRTAMCLVESLQNTWTMHGPLHPYAPTELALSAAAIFFSIVASPQISYTMACFAEIHFNDVRKSMLQIIRGSYTRPRDGPKDITPTFLKDRMRFDTEDEAVDFAQKHGFVFKQNGASSYAVLNARQPIEDTRIRHAYSKSIVEHKRSGRSLPDVIHKTFYYQDIDDPTSVEADGEGLFVPQAEEKDGESLSVPETEDISQSFLNDDETDTPDSLLPGTSQGTIDVPSLDAEHHSSARDKTETSSSSIFGRSSLFPKSSAPFAVPASEQNANPQTTTSIFAPSLTSPATQLNSTTSLNGAALLNTDSSIPRPDNTSNGVSQGSKPAPTLGGISFPSIFGALGQGNNEPPKPAANPLASTSVFDTLSKPVLFPATSGQEKPSIFAANPTTGTVPPNLLAPSSGPAHMQSPNPIIQDFARQSQSTNATTDDGPSSQGQGLSIFSSHYNPSLPDPKQDTIAPSNSASATGLGFISHGKQQEKTDTIRDTKITTAPTTSASRKDPMGDFTRWFVLGDNGLMEDELEKFAVVHYLKSTWEDFHIAEKERIRKEEDEKSWAEALKYRHYSLKVTFFYRWLRITRKQRVIRRIKLEKAKAREWNMPHNIALREIAAREKKKNAVQEAKELVKRRSMGQANGSALLRESTRSRQSLDEALLGRESLSGVETSSVVSHLGAPDDDIHSETGMSERLRLRAENQRRRQRGLAPLKQLDEPKAPKQGKKTALLRAISRGSASLSMSPGSLRNSTFGSSFRSSLGLNQSSRVAKSRSSVSDPYWRMKANGLVQMPNGEYLHESLALPMLQEGKRFPGLGDYGLPPQQSFTPSQSPPAGLGLLTQLGTSPPVGFPESNQGSRSPSNYDDAPQNRKRKQSADDDLAAYRNEAPAARKRARSGDHVSTTTSDADQEFLSSIANLLDRVTAVADSANH